MCRKVGGPLAEPAAALAQPAAALAVAAAALSVSAAAIALTTTAAVAEAPAAVALAALTVVLAVPTVAEPAGGWRWKRRREGGKGSGRKVGRGIRGLEGSQIWGPRVRPVAWSGLG